MKEVEELVKARRILAARSFDERGGGDTLFLPFRRSTPYWIRRPKAASAASGITSPNIETVMTSTGSSV